MSSLLDNLKFRIEQEYGLARAASSRAALTYLQAGYEEGFHVGERDVAAVLARRAPALTPDPRRVAQVSAYTFDAIKGVESLGRERVRDVFQRATDDATLDVGDVKDMLAAEFNDLADSRLATIARTEVNRAGNAALSDYFTAVGVRQKEALTAEDARVRTFDTSDADHTALDGQVVPVDQPFRVPRQGNAGPSSFSNFDMHPPFDPNCRCTMLPVIARGTQGFARRDVRLRAWRAGVNAYAGSMYRDSRRAWSKSFARVNHLVDTMGREALVDARKR